MDDVNYSDEQLNMFIDDQLDTEDKNVLRQRMLDDAVLRERVCQLKAVRELVGVAYENVPRSSWDRRQQKNDKRVLWKSLAASMLLGLGVLLGWQGSNYSYANTTGLATASSAFNFFANLAKLDYRERKIVLHINNDDIGAINAALDEANTLLASYKQAKAPLKIDIVANKSGINLFRVGVSPYIARIAKMVEDYDVSLYACDRSIMKAQEKEGGRQVVLMPGANTHKSARDLIPERLEDGWVYIKA